MCVHMSLSALHPRFTPTVREEHCFKFTSSKLFKFGCFKQLPFRSIRFLTHQHKDTLTSLHEEIEKLKRANKGETREHNTCLFRSEERLSVIKA